MSVLILDLVFSHMQASNGVFKHRTLLFPYFSISLFRLIGMVSETCLQSNTYKMVNVKKNYNVGLKTLLQRGISELELYGDLVYRFRKIMGKYNFSEQFRKLINLYIRIGYSMDIIRQTACLVINTITGYVFLFNCTTAVRASDSVTASS